MPSPVTIFCDRPAIPFGLASATAFTDEASCCEFLARLPDAPSRFGAIGPTADFRIQLRNVALPGVSLVGGAGTAKATTHSSRRITLVIPFGRCETVLREGADEHRWAAPHHAFFIPANVPIGAESTSGAFLRLDMVETALTRTAAGMKAAPHGSLDLNRSRIVPLQIRGMNWLPVIRSLCSTIDAFDCDPARLVAAGFDDVLLRTAVMMLRPEVFLEKQWSARPSRSFDLGPLLERIEANLGGRITLAELEAWSGRTARAIQLAFQKRFGIGPIEWVRNRRLEKVRERLIAAKDGDTVREIAAACGITRMGTLIPEYAARFGERPSETLRGRGA
jgi:AraC-like DNA-binding protein